MPEWLIERGIGETRAVLVDDGRITESRIIREATVQAGAVLDAVLIKGGRNAVARAGAQEFLLPQAAPGTTEGAPFRIEVTRESLGGAEPWKRPLAKATGAPPGDPPALEGRTLIFPSPVDELDMAGWSELIDEARRGIVGFPGGELRIAVTPAMTLIDVDGVGKPDVLALAAAHSAADTIRRHGIGGSIGIDFPTIEGKAARQAVAKAVDAVLTPPFERTSVNGFGFLQIIRPRTHASLFELAADRPAFECRALLRRAGRETGATRIVAHPAVIDYLTARPDWLERLSLQVGGSVGLRAEPALGMAAGYAERA